MDSRDILEVEPMGLGWTGRGEEESIKRDSRVPGLSE